MGELRGFLRYIDAVLDLYGGPPPIYGECPECGAEWGVWERICPGSADGRCGYRTIWRCQSCGEMEMR